MTGHRPSIPPLLSSSHREWNDHGHGSQAVHKKTTRGCPDHARLQFPVLDSHAVNIHCFRCSTCNPLAAASPNLHCRLVRKYYTALIRHRIMAISSSPSHTSSTVGRLQVRLTNCHTWSVAHATRGTSSRPGNWRFSGDARKKISQATVLWCSEKGVYVLNEGRVGKLCAALLATVAKGTSRRSAIHSKSQLAWRRRHMQSYA